MPELHNLTLDSLTEPALFVCLAWNPGLNLRFHFKRLAFGFVFHDAFQNSY